MAAVSRLLPQQVPVLCDVVPKAVGLDEFLVGVLLSCSIKRATRNGPVVQFWWVVCGKAIISGSLAAIVDSWTLLYFNRQHVQEGGTVVENYWSAFAGI